VSHISLATTVVADDAGICAERAALGRRAGVRGLETATDVTKLERFAVAGSASCVESLLRGGAEVSKTVVVSALRSSPEQSKS